MTFSMVQALDILNNKKNNIDLDDLLYILVTFRDNAKDENVYMFLDSVLTEGIDDID